jgi:hypothetical protein
MNSKYRELNRNPPKWKVVKNAREVILTTISCMCDNVHRITLKKNSDGDFKMSGNGFALSNWQMKHPIHDIEWAADEGNWLDVVLMINSGTSVIEKIQSR